MANFTAVEDFLFSHNCDNVNHEFSNIMEDPILLSLLEDSHVEDGDDDERLRYVIQSLEAEIINQDSYLEKSNSSDHDYVRFCDTELSQMNSCSTSPGDHDLAFDWIDMEMDYATPSDEMNGYYLMENMENMVDQFGAGVGDYYSQVCYDGMSMEEDNYTALWQ